MTRARSRWPAATEQRRAGGPVSHQEVAQAAVSTRVGEFSEGKVEKAGGLKNLETERNHIVLLMSRFNCRCISFFFPNIVKERR